MLDRSNTNHRGFASKPNRPAIRRVLTSALPGLVAVAPPGTASARAAWPTPIRMVVTFPSGGSIDIVARLIAPIVGEKLGQPIVVENRPGAGAAIGTAEVARAAPDGHTFMLSNTAPMRPYRSEGRRRRYAGRPAPEIPLPMPSERWLAWLLFAFVMAITPGPNNVMLMASGARFGVRRTNPHCLGVALGFGAMFFAVELGAGVAIASSRVLVETMRWASIAFLGWIAWSIATAPVHAADAVDRADAAGVSKPLGFLGGAAFQWINPKAWMLCVGAAGTYVPQDAGAGLVVAMSAALAAITWMSAGTWMVAGQALREALRPPGRQRAFNLAMAVLLVASVVPALRS